MTTQTHNEKLAINVNDTVRSHDFDDHSTTGERACYIEGTVEKTFTNVITGYKMHQIRVTKQVFGGEEKTTFAEFAYAPVNGSKQMFGEPTYGVYKL